MRQHDERQKQINPEGIPTKQQKYTTPRGLFAICKLPGGVFLCPQKKRAALYIRVSSEKQARHGYSLAEQEYDLRRYAEQQGYVLIGVYADEGTSARKALSRRRSLQWLLEDVQTGSIDIIVFKCLDRWFRNIADYYKFQEILDQYNVLWECTQENFNTTTTNGRLLLNLKLSIAQHESDQTGDRIRYIFDGHRREGKVITGQMPLGYRVGKDKRIHIDQRKAEMAREMFQFFLINRTVLGTTRMLREKYGYRKSDSSIGRTLQNRIYVGEYYGVKNFCPPLIDENTLIQVQKVFAGRTRYPRSGNIYLFTGLLRCPNCGKVLTPAYSHTKKRTYIYYVCRNYTHSDYPYKTYWREDRVESDLLDKLDHTLKRYRANVKKISYKEDTEKIQLSAESIRAKQARLQELYVEGMIPRVEFDARYSDLNTQIIALQPSKEMFLDYVKSIDNFREYYDALDKQARKTFWSTVLDQIRISSGKLLPFFRAF